jgi:ribonuclease BN (tRNA processing enzyme)
LVLVGTRASKGFDQLQKTLEAELKGDVRQIVAVADFLQSEKAGRLPEGADLLIIEEKYESRTDQIHREVEILSMQQATVLGTVIL